MQLTVTVENNVTPMLEGAQRRVAGGAFRDLVRQWGLRLQAQVKANAVGRPGPRMVTGDYNRSIALTFVSTGSEHTATVGTNKPQGRRLEYGFTGTDSLGRKYAQPPYPHFSPAKDKIEPGFRAACQAKATELLRPGGGMNTASGDGT